MKRDFSCKSVGFTSLLIINRDLAFKIFKENEEDFERFAMIKDEILFKNSFSLISHRCMYCRSFKHPIKLCPFLHYIADKEKILKQSQFYFEEPRKNIERRKIIRFSKENLATKALQFQETQEEINIPILQKYQIEDFSEVPVASLEYLDDDQNALGFGFVLGEKKENESDKAQDKENSERISSIFKKEKDLGKDNEKVTLLLSEGKKEVVSPLLLEAKSENLARQNRNINKRNSFFDTDMEVLANKKKPSTIMTAVKTKSQVTSNMITQNNISEFKKERNVFESMKYYKNYYPKMNHIEVIQNVNKTNIIQKKFKEFVLLFYADKEIQKKIDLKIQKMQKYTFYSGKIGDLIKMSIVKKLRLEIPTLFSQFNSPTGIKKKKTFTGFFDRNHVRSEKDFKSLISKVIRNSKNEKIIQKKTFCVKLFKKKTKDTK